VRHVIRSPHARFVIVALCSCIAARVGSEVASRLPVIASGAGVAAVVVPWRAVWWACSGVVAVAALVSRHAVWNSQRCLAVLVVLTAVHGAVEWQRLASPRSGEFSGVAIARSDAVPRSYGGSTPASTRRASALSLIVEVDGENFRLTLHGGARNQIRRVKMGDVLLLDAERVPYDHRRLRFSAGRHVQGELRNVTVHGTSPAPTLWHRAANRIHELVDRGARNMQPDDAALVRGLVLGDESRQPSRMTEAFREAGLGHLLAVSGQNVVLILAALTPLLRRFTRWWRLSAALGVVAMFAVITRVESSVVRAAVMAGVVQVGFAIGRDVMPLRALAITVLGMVSVDPLATWSVGFVLSVAATTGLIAITPHLGSSIFSATTAAQLGVAPFVLLWFGSMPIVALVTNVFAVPVASLVMMIAPPLLAAAAFVPDVVAQVLGAPVVAATRWVWWVAELGARVQVPGVLNAVAWGVVVSGILWRARRS
jgi:ComEC/Rec2-related protein